MTASMNPGMNSGTDPATNAIEASGLGKRYGRKWALRDCTLAVPAGHVMALVGPNGSGKTTLLHQVVGLAAPTAGQVRVLGDVPGSPDALERIGSDSWPRTPRCTARCPWPTCSR